MFSSLRRYGILLLLVLVVAGWFTWNRVRANRLAEQRESYAQVVARLWVAGATFRSDTTGWAGYRDSIIALHGVSRERLEEYASRYESKPEKYLPFVERVQELVDSLVNEHIAGPVDSLKTDDSPPSD